MINHAESNTRSGSASYSIRIRALVLGTLWAAAGGIIGIIIHFVTKGSAFPIVPLFGISGVTGALVGLYIAVHYKNVTLGGTIAAISFAICTCGLVIFTDGIHSALLPSVISVPAFSAAFWNPKGALFSFIGVFLTLIGCAVGEYFGVFSHAYFGQFPDLRAAAFTQSVFVSLSMVAGSVYAYTKEQATIRIMLKESAEQVREAESTRRRFLENMTHELRTPLNGVSGILALLKMENLSPEQAKYVDKIDHCARDFEALVTNILLAASQPTNPKLEVLDLELLYQNMHFQSHIIAKPDFGNHPLIKTHSKSLMNMLELVSKAAIHRQLRSPIQTLFFQDDNSRSIVFEDQGPPLNSAEFSKILESFENLEMTSGLASNSHISLGFAAEIALRVGAKLSYHNDDKFRGFYLTLPAA